MSSRHRTHAEHEWEVGRHRGYSVPQRRRSAVTLQCVAVGTLVAAAVLTLTSVLLHSILSVQHERQLVERQAAADAEGAAELKELVRRTEETTRHRLNEQKESSAPKQRRSKTLAKLVHEGVPTTTNDPYISTYKLESSNPDIAARVARAKQRSATAARTDLGAGPSYDQDEVHAEPQWAEHRRERVARLQAAEHKLYPSADTHSRGRNADARVHAELLEAELQKEGDIMRARVGKRRKRTAQDLTMEQPPSPGPLGNSMRDFVRSQVVTENSEAKGSL